MKNDNIQFENGESSLRGKPIEIKALHIMPNRNRNAPFSSHRYSQMFRHQNCIMFPKLNFTLENIFKKHYDDVYT